MKLYALLSNSIALVIVASTYGSDVYAEDCDIHFKALTFEEAKVSLRAQIAANLEDASELAPIRTLKDYKVIDLNSGQPFKYKFFNDYSDIALAKKVDAIGKRLIFKLPDGQNHSIDIIAGVDSKEDIDDLVAKIAGLPADALPATKLVQLVPHRIHANGFAEDNFFVLSRAGSKSLKDIQHEFGHNLASYIWGNTEPWKEWRSAFHADNKSKFGKEKKRAFASSYAAMSSKSVFAAKLTEDFAESVMLYLQDSQIFRSEFPNRAALLDTIFRDPSGSPFQNSGNWTPIRRRYNSKPHKIVQYYVRQPMNAAIRTAAAVPLIAMTLVFAAEEVKQIIKSD